MKRVLWANVFLVLLWVTFTGTLHIERLLWGMAVIGILQWLYAKVA